MLSCFVYDHGESARSWNLLGFDSYVQVTEFGYVSRLVSGAQYSINIPSREEERVGTFIQKPHFSGFVALLFSWKL